VFRRGFFPGLPLSRPSAALSALAQRLETRMGGSSGAFYSIMLESASAVLQPGTVHERRRAAWDAPPI